MAGAKQLDRTPSKRIIGDETPLEGLMRLKTEREREVREKDIEEWKEAFKKKLRDKNEGLKDAAIRLYDNIAVPADDPYVKGGSAIILALCSHDNAIASAFVVVIKKEGRVEAVIEEVQGEGNREQMDRFTQENGHHGLVFLTDSIKDSAYESGFSRVLLRDVTTREEYENPFPKSRMTREEAQSYMKQTNDFLRHECKFTKKEGNFYVREFP